jgi:hypothetical protein
MEALPLPNNKTDEIWCNKESLMNNTTAGLN